MSLRGIEIYGTFWPTRSLSSMPFPNRGSAIVRECSRQKWHSNFSKVNEVRAVNSLALPLSLPTLCHISNFIMLGPEVLALKHDSRILEQYRVDGVDVAPEMERN